MLLYHGSNVGVRNPIIQITKRNLDFGDGFYLTTDLEQAKKWALLVTERTKSGKAIVSVFEYNEYNDLKIKKFDEPKKEWLEYVVSNRKRLFDNNNKYDIIIGPVANDNSMPVITLYLNGVLTENEAVERLLPQKLTDQIVFKNDISLRELKFKEEITYDNERY